MRAKTEELLNLLLWSLDTVARPNYRNLEASFEEWAYRRGLLRQIARLEQRKFVEGKSGGDNDRVYRLSVLGRLKAIGGRDPEARWRRPWDGRWRLVLFDVPTKRNSQREWLRRYLRSRGFGFLQNSVWITPDELEQEREVLVGAKIDVETLILLEARPCAGESNQEIVAGAWDFGKINRHYAQHLKVLRQRPTGSLSNGARAKELLGWARRERTAWLTAVQSDPLLPEKILPAGYLGRKAWRERIKTFRRAGRQTAMFARNFASAN